MAQSTALLDAIGKYQMYHTNYMEVTLFISNCIERAKRASSTSTSTTICREYCVCSTIRSYPLVSP